MNVRILDLIDFEKINILLEGFYKTTGFQTAILDLDGNVLSKSGWRSICTHFHRVNPKSADLCRISDTELAGKMAEGQQFHHYQCLNGLVDVAVPIKVRGEHIANLFTGQFFYDEPNMEFFRAQAKKYNFDEKEYFEALSSVPVVSKEKVKVAMDFLLDVTQLITEMIVIRQEQLELNQTIRKNEERFRIAQEYSPDGFTILHPIRNEKNEVVDFVWVYENQTIAKINHTNPDQVKGKSLLELFPSHAGTSIFEAYTAVATTREPIILDDIYVGEVVSVPTWLRLVVVPMDEDIAVLAQDITGRKKSEQQILHFQELMKYIIEHNQSAVAVHDTNLNYIYVSQRYLSDYRIKDTNIIGKHHYDVFPDIPEKWREVHKKALEGIVSKSEEDVFYRRDGSIDWTRWECRPWYELTGSIGGIVVYTEVINDRKQKELEINQLNHRLEILIDVIQQLSSAQSLEVVQEIVAHSARQLIGADGATLVFKENNMCCYVNEDAIQPLWKGRKFPLDECISGWVMQHKQSVIIEDIFTDSRIPIDIYSPTFVKSLAMVPINVSNPIGAIGNYWKDNYCPNETEMQLLQTLANAAARSIENIQLYAELEKRVQQRTEQLQAANKELETFTYSVSHDLKAPLRGIDGYSKLLLVDYGDKLNDEAVHFIKTIRSSILQMHQLIDDLLSYSRLERAELKRKRIAIKPFIDTLLGSYYSVLNEKGFSLRVNIPDIKIIADETGLSISLRNVIENAIKFTDGTSSPTIEIGLEENPDNWILKIKDNGVGFDMKYHDRIFEIFQRLHHAEEFPGTGIGLAMVAKALQRMNGKTFAESSPGQGSTFFIELPKNTNL